MIVRIKDINSEKMRDLDLEEMTGIGTAELSELSHRIINHKDYDASLKILRAGVRKRTSDLDIENSAFYLVRDYFDSLHWLECKKAGTEPVFGLELPFNGSFDYGTGAKEIRKIEAMTGKNWWKRITHSFQDIAEFDGGPTVIDLGWVVMDRLLNLKYLTKFLPTFYHLQLKEHNTFRNRGYSSKTFHMESIKEKNKIVTEKWLEEKIDFQRLFIKDYFSELDFNLLEQDWEKEYYEDPLVKNYSYPKDFFQKTLASLNL